MAVVDVLVAVVDVVDVAPGVCCGVWDVSPASCGPLSARRGRSAPPAGVSDYQESIPERIILSFISNVNHTYTKCIG